ncbi:MAG: DUF4474 domain-containing protein [Clostridia bacterium]|nr:DUF4474 domain-containing protein [Clostridia bacterium]
MNAKITRVIAAILAFSMIICCFTACGGNGDDETTTTPDIEFPTNPSGTGDGEPSTGGVSSSGGASSSLGSLSGNNYTGSNQLDITPNYSGNSGSSSGSSSGSTYYPSTGNSSSSSSTSIEDEFNHFLTHFDTPEERKHILSLAGYEYDEGQDIFYTHLNPWQRHFGFTDLYDQAAPITNMWYLTLKADFLYDDLLWRLQWWKGQYGVLEGAELGVYTKSPYDNSGFYKCAEDEQLLTMVLDYYHSWDDYKNGNRLFTRAEQEHWWLTGFKFGVVQPKKCVVRATLYAYDDEMADGIEAALQNLTDGNNKLTGKGFVPYRKGITNKDFYIRNGNRFSVVWYEAGYLNYNTYENPEANNPNVEIPTTPDETTTNTPVTLPSVTLPSVTTPTTEPTTAPTTVPTTTEPVAEPSSADTEAAE